MSSVQSDDNTPAQSDAVVAATTAAAADTSSLVQDAAALDLADDSKTAVAAVTAVDEPEPESDTESVDQGLLDHWSENPDDAFSEGVWSALNMYDVIQMAVEGQWGGAYSADKLDSLYGEILDFFDAKKNTNEHQIESLLKEVLADDFNVILDEKDDGAFRVAKLLVTLRRDVYERKDFEGLLVISNAFRAREEQIEARRANRQLPSSTAHTDAAADTKDDDTLQSNDEQEQQSDQADAADTDTTTTDAPPVDDGWTVVPSKKKKKKKKKNNTN
jgi:pre-rRNA-processing protein TSR2